MRLRRRRRGLWAWSWLLTLPVCVVWLYWGWTTYRGWANFGLRYDPAPESYTLVDAGTDTWKHLVRQVRVAFRPTKGPAAVPASGLRTINLFVTEDHLAQLDSDLPHSGFEYVKGLLWDGRDMLEAKVRYRGDFISHWGFPKKSLRVRTKRETLFEGLRTFNLIAAKYPEQVNNYLGYRLAHEMGVLAPRVELVQVAVNGKNRGVHLFCEQLDETTLRQNDCMPGDVYVGEMLGKDGWEGITGAVFEHVGLWEKISVNNHYDEESRAPLVHLANLLNDYPSEATHTRLSELFDMEAWGRFSAFESLAQTYHFDHAHNWRLYYDANRGCFVPLVWDPIAWAPHFLRPRQPVRHDILTSRLHTVLYQNGDFLRARDDALREAFASGLDRRFLRETDDALAALRTALLLDPNVRPLDDAQIDERIREFRESVRRSFAEIQETCLGGGGRVRFARLGGSGSFAVEVDGREPVERLVLHFDEPIDRPVRAFLRTFHGGETAQTDVSGAVSVSGRRIELGVGLLSVPQTFFVARAMSMKNLGVRFAPAYYELIVEGLDATNHVYEVLVDRGGATAVPAERVDAIPPRPMDLFRAVDPAPAYDPEVWSGDVPIEGVVEVAGDLILRPGTRVRLAPDASVIVRGRILAEGTPERPIEIGPFSEDQEPWGAFVLQGQRTSGSRLSFCRFALGSGLKRDMFEYSAMFSVHDSTGVSIEHCSFRDGRVVDDMVHAVYADISFKGCLFERALSDALDLDICKAAIEECRFVESGNDGVDLMTTEAVVVDTHLLQSGDKGISVGEGSNLLVANSRFEGCVIGLQAKDSSRATVLNSDFVGNDKPVDAYKKNWRYADGGHVLLAKCLFEGNREAVSADKDSSITVEDSFFEGPLPDLRGVSPRKIRVAFGSSVDAENRRQAQQPFLALQRAELGPLQQRSAAAWSRVDARKRGARLE